MKLLYLMTEPFGVGGVQSDILALTEDLARKGHEVYVATRPGVLLDELIEKGARYVDLQFLFRGPAGFVKAAIGLRRIIREHNIELVAPQSVRTSMVCYFALRFLPYSYRVAGTRCQIPIVTTIHNIHNPMHFRYAGRILNRCSDFVIFESHYERDRVSQSGLPKIRSCVIHSGIDTDRFKPLDPVNRLYKKYGLDPDRHKVLGIVARLSEEKGHNYLLMALAKVLQRDQSIRLLIIGDGPLMQETQELARSLEIEDFVVFTGLQRDIPEHLSILNAFVLSSTRESFPLAAREAMAAGRAVIAPDIGGCPEVVDDGNTGFLFESANVDALAETIEKILANDLYKDLGVRARERVEKLFSRRQWIEGDEKVYLDHLCKEE